MTQDQSERDRCAAIVRDALAHRPTIHTLTTYGRGERDYVRLFIVDESDSTIRELTYYVARAAGWWHLKQGAGWSFGGSGYSKGQEAFDTACHIAGIPSDQAKWREL